MSYDALGAVSRLSASRYGTFTRTEATQHGLHRSTVRQLISAGALFEDPPGVLRWSAAGRRWEQDLAAALLAGGGHGVAAMRSAARLHGLDGFESEPTIELLSERRLKVPGAITHITASLPAGDLVVIGGLPCTGLARTLCDLGAVAGVARVERALDSARRSGVSVRWLSEAVWRLHRPGPSGTGTLLKLLAQLDDSPVRDSWWERTIELMLRDPRIPPLRRQYVIRDDTGAFVARADLAVPELRLAIEAHSRQFHFGRIPEAADEDRDHRLSKIGWDAIYLGHQSTRRPEATRDLVAQALGARAALLGVDLAALCRSRP